MTMVIVVPRIRLEFIRMGTRRTRQKPYRRPPQKSIGLLREELAEAAFISSSLG